MSINDAERISRVSADAVSAAMRLINTAMPDASEARGLLMILANAAVSCGRLRVDRADVLALIEGGYDQGALLPRERSLFPRDE